MMFDVKEVMDDKIMEMFVNFLRFVTFKGDLEILMLAKYIQDQSDRKAQKVPPGTPIDSTYNGCNQEFISVESELAVWKHVNDICQELLDAYPTSYEEDLQILKEEEENSKLN